MPEELAGDDLMELDAPPSNQAALFQNDGVPMMSGPDQTSEVSITVPQAWCEADSAHPTLKAESGKSDGMSALERALDACGFVSVHVFCLTLVTPLNPS